jgi:uncharacterized protein with NRDE domain
VCTVVCRWSTDVKPLQMLALRDELTTRAFDLPGEWWPDQPGVIGGRDRQAGGSWCVSDVATGVTAVVLNRQERRVAEPGATSRGVLPLLAVRHRERWPQFVDVTPMASFNLVLAGPDSLSWWSFDGERLQAYDLPRGTYMFNTYGLRSEEIDIRLATGHARSDAAPNVTTEEVWADWLEVLEEAVPGDGTTSVLIHIELEEGRFETVFGQFIAAQPGALRLDYELHPYLRRDWQTRIWPADERQPAERGR